MGLTEQTGESMLNKTYTLREAVEYMKAKNKRPSQTGSQTIWIDIKTKKVVSIGYTG